MHTEPFTDRSFTERVNRDIANERNSEARLYFNFSSKDESDLAKNILDSIAREFSQMQTGNGFMEYYKECRPDPELTKKDTGIEVTFSHNPENLERRVYNLLIENDFKVSKEVHKTVNGQPVEVTI